MRTLLVDNYDSFTYNLYQLLSVVNGAEPTVVPNDAALTMADLDEFDNVVISPGPGHPARARDFGISATLIADATLPLLGVCLGHQGIVIAAGGEVTAAPTPRHGYLDTVRHDGSELFAGVPQDFTVVRYHSLAAAEPLPDDLVATARSSDGVIMAVRHRTRPQWGVQFHPESIASEYGDRLLRNFVDLTRRRGRREHISLTPPPLAPVTPERRYRAEIGVIERAVDTEVAFDALYSTAPQAFWLDGALTDESRFSFLGDASGPWAERISYRVGTGKVTSIDAGGNRSDHTTTIFDYLSARLASRVFDIPDLPFDFTGGYVGYFGYECKADTAGPATHRSSYPDAHWIFADRLVVVDHAELRTYVLALHDDSDDARMTAQNWIATTAATLADTPTGTQPTPLPRHLDSDCIAGLLTRGREHYLADVESCRSSLRAGESYELCLTDSITFDAAESGLAFYRVLRRVNPAPYAAYLRFGDLEIACSSPERFLKVDRAGIVESKPIKGTARRGDSPADDDRLRAELQSSTKTRAENLIIVDLIRNDLGRVCRVGSVHVPSLMAVETFRTVHQLVSTVRGTLRPGADAIDCVRACFPGGSMTGAPKLRTLEILDELEGRARGIYSGAIGFLGPHRTADLNIVIRTAVRDRGGWHIGAGGAVVLDSDPVDEYDEMVLKLLATLRARTL